MTDFRKTSDSYKKYVSEIWKLVGLRYKSHSWHAIGDCSPALISRLKHYFLTYKEMPGRYENKCEITHAYGRDEAHEVIERSLRLFAQVWQARE